MSGIYSLDIVCDFRDPETGERCGEREEGTTGTKPPRLDEARMASGYARAYGPSSCGYDLCPLHGHEVPGETFQDWRGVKGPIPGRRPACTRA